MSIHSFFIYHYVTKQLPFWVSLWMLVLMTWVRRVRSLPADRTSRHKSQHILKHTCPVFEMGGG